LDSRAESGNIYPQNTSVVVPEVCHRNRDQAKGPLTFKKLLNIGYILIKEIGMV
jgi:hypothetical protein